MRKVFKALYDLLPVLLLILGAAAVAVGVWLIYAPAGYIVAGALLIVGAVMMIRGDDNEHKT